MAKMIITRSQLKSINEAAFGGEIPNGNVEKAIRDYKSNGSNNLDEPITFMDSNITNNKDNAAFNPNNPNDSKGASQITVSPGVLKNMTESRYTKRQIELARLLEMRKNGKVYSKKQLNEMFMETQENAKRLRDGIGGCDVFEIIDAVDEFFPEESENFKEALHNGADLAEYLCSIFSSGKVDADKEEEFLDSLGL